MGVYSALRYSGFSAILPARALAELARLIAAADPDATVGVRVGDKRVAFRVADTTITTTRNEGEFPSYRQLLPERYPNLNFVSVESGIGWIPFLLDAMDYQCGETAPDHLAHLSLKPSEYFMRQFVPDIKREYTLLPNNIRITIGSYGSERILGANVICAFCDETNFPPKRKAQQITTAFGQKLTAAHFDVVEKVYGGLVRRIKSRFQKAVSDFPGMVVLASSAATVDSFTERKIRQSQDDPGIFIVQQVFVFSFGDHIAKPLFAQRVVEIQPNRSKQYIVQPLFGILPVRHEAVKACRQP